jgi:hypothetical protein
LGTSGVVLLWGATAGLGLGLAVAAALGRNWCWFLASALFPLTTILAALNFWSVWGAGQFAGDYLHFLVKYPSYRTAISKQPSGAPRILVDDWGGVLPMSSHGLVYDESDEITKPEAERSAAWKERVRGTEGECIYGGTPIGGHFYLVSLDC